MDNSVMFVSSGVMSAAALDELNKKLQEAFPSHRFVMLPPGVAVSNPFDVPALCESVSRLHEAVCDLIKVNQELLANNQEMLAEIIEMHQEAEEVSNPEHHLGLAGLG